MYSRFCGLLYIVFFCALEKSACSKLTHKAFRAKNKVFSCYFEH